MFRALFLTWLDAVLASRISRVGRNGYSDNLFTSVATLIGHSKLNVVDTVLTLTEVVARLGIKTESIIVRIVAARVIIFAIRSFSRFYFSKTTKALVCFT